MLTKPAIADPERFIRANTRLRAVPLVPEISIYVADEAVPLWQKTEEELNEDGLPPPFWAFAWAGGQALARYVLDHRELVAGKRVLDIASGSGLVAIAAMKAGAREVTSTDIDAFAGAAARINAEANAVTLSVSGHDFLRNKSDARWDAILAGDIFYERDTAELALAFLARHAARGATILIGDPGRSYLPKDKLTQLAEYRVPVTRELEDAEIKRTAVWTIGLIIRPVFEPSPLKCHSRGQTRQTRETAMTLSGANVLVIVIAAIAAWMFGAAYYTPLGKVWLAAQGRTMEEMQAANAGKSGAAKAFPFVLSLVAELIMAWTMYGLLFHTGNFSARAGIISGAIVWFGFVLTTVAVNNAYPGRKLMLTMLDSAHWLGVLVIIGAIVGGFGG